MKILVDESLPPSLRHEFIGHDAFSTQYMGWLSLGNGVLLAAASDNGFDVLITRDKSIEYQQNLLRLGMALITLRVHSNRRKDLVPLMPRVLRVLPNLKPGDAITIHE